MIDLNDLRLEVETLEPRNLLDYTIAGVLPAAPTNLITNGAFTTAVTGWTAGTGWTNTWNAGQFLRANGNVAGVLTWTSVTAAAGQVLNGSVRMTPGGTTPLQNGPETYQAYLIAYNASNVSLGVVGQSAAETWNSGAGNAGYRTLTINTTQVTPANTTSVRMELYKNSSNTAAVTVDVDDAVLYRETSGVTGWTATGALVTAQAASWSLAGNAFRLRALGGQAGYLTNDTPAIATDSTKFVGASIMATGNTYARIGIQWLNSSGAQISITYSAYYLLNSNPQRMEYRTQPPAGAVRPVFRVYLYTNPQGGNPVWGAEAVLDGAVLISAATADLDDDLSYEMTNDTPNYIVNPSGQGGTFGWTETDDAGYFHNSFIDQPFEDRQYNYQWRWPDDYNDSDTAPVMIYSITNSVLTPGAYSNTKTAAAGQYVGGSVRMYAAVPGHVGRAGWTFLNATGGVISTSWSAWATPYDASTNVANGISRIYKLPTMTAPTGTARVRMELEWAKNAAPVVNQDELYYGHWFMFWNAGMIIGASAGEVEGFPAQNPKKYRNILGPTSEIKLKTGEWEVGILSAVIHDALIDPANDPTMAVGAEVRLRVKYDGTWSNRFVGKVQTLKTTYSRTGVPKINLTAVDSITDLVKTRRTQGVSTIPEIGALLQGVDVPWTVNGSGQYTGTPTYTYTNDATLKDHITITRDTQKGYVWVDKDGIIRVFDQAKMAYSDARMIFTDKTKPVAANIRTNLLENPRGNQNSPVGSPGRYVYYGGSVATNATRGYVISGPASAITGDPIGLVFTPAASAVLKGDRSDVFTVRTKVKAVKAIRVQLGHFSYTNGFFDLQPFVDLTAGQEIELWGTFFASSYSSSQTWFRPMVKVTNSGSSTALAGGLGQIADVQWMVMERGNLASQTYFDGDSTYAYWTGTPYDSPSVYDNSQWISYTGLDSGWSSTDTVNSITVKVLSGTTTTDNGPYLNAASMDQYGTSSLNATITTGPVPATWAQGILNAKAAPTVTPGQVTFAAIDAGSFKKAATIDLYDSVQVEFQNKINGQFRITSLEHEIKPGRWIVRMNFNKRVDSTLW